MLHLGRVLRYLEPEGTLNRIWEEMFVLYVWWRHVLATRDQPAFVSLASPHPKLPRRPKATRRIDPSNDTLASIPPSNPT